MKLQDAAQRLGVHYQTAYHWVRTGDLPATKVGRGYQVTEADLRRFEADRSTGAPPPPAIQVRDWSNQARRLFTSLASGNELRARLQIDRLSSGQIPVVDICALLLAPALMQIGDAWAAGRMSVAEEHRASAICERLLAPLAQPRPGRPRGIALVTTPPGEQHNLPALMATAALREDHWVVHHLAANVPWNDSAELAEKVGAGLVVLSMTTTGARGAASELRALQARLTNARVLVGGPGSSLYQLLASARGQAGSGE